MANNPFYPMIVAVHEVHRLSRMPSLRGAESGRIASTVYLEVGFSHSLAAIQSDLLCDVCATFRVVQLLRIPFPTVEASRFSEIFVLSREVQPSADGIHEP